MKHETFIILPKKNLDEITNVRFFSGDRKKREGYMRRFKDRWDNDSHFIRSAVQHFFDHLEGKYLRLECSACGNLMTVTWSHKAKVVVSCSYCYREKKRRR